MLVLHLHKLFFNSAGTSHLRSCWTTQWSNSPIYLQVPMVVHIYKTVA